MAQPKTEGGQPKVSLLRFSQLQKSYSWDEFYRRLIRMVKLLDGNINIVSLTDDIFHWAREFNGDFEQSPMNRLQVRWAGDYYHIINAKPTGK
jgi:CRISPR system Cascade subunit CasB